MVRDIVLHPDARLRRVADPVDRVGGEVRDLLDEMLETMYAAPGIGLAAPQLGLGLRAVVMDCAQREDEDAPRQPLCLVNPEIVSASEAVREYEEGCLSIPDVFGKVTRPEAVRVRFLDRAGERREEDFDGLWAVCVQHEIDHLDGKLFIDFLSPMRRQMITRKMQKLKRERARESAA